MLTTFWSAKGGVGTTTTALIAAVNVARRGVRTVLVDLGGDMPSALGVRVPVHGLTDLLALERSPSAAQVERVSEAVNPTLTILRRGSLAPDEIATAREAAVLMLDAVLEVLGRAYQAVIVDCGCLAPNRESPVDAAWISHELMRRADLRIVVTRLCYLSIARTRAALSGLGPLYTDMVIVREAGRALRVRDLDDSFGSSSIEVIEADPGIARMVDCGSLVRRAPKLGSGLIDRCSGGPDVAARWPVRLGHKAPR